MVNLSFRFHKLNHDVLQADENWVNAFNDDEFDDLPALLDVVDSDDEGSEWAGDDDEGLEYGGDPDANGANIFDGPGDGADNDDNDDEDNDNDDEDNDNDDDTDDEGPDLIDDELEALRNTPANRVQRSVSPGPGEGPEHFQNGVRREYHNVLSGELPFCGIVCTFPEALIHQRNHAIRMGTSFQKIPPLSSNLGKRMTGRRSTTECRLKLPSSFISKTKCPKPRSTSSWIFGLRHFCRQG